MLYVLHFTEPEKLFDYPKFGLNRFCQFPMAHIAIIPENISLEKIRWSLNLCIFYVLYICRHWDLKQLTKK